jgi:hypothetical protein
MPPAPERFDAVRTADGRLAVMLARASAAGERGLTWS